MDIGNWTLSGLYKYGKTFEKCSVLSCIRFPGSLNKDIELPSGTSWYYDGTAVTALPKNAAGPGLVTRGNTKAAVFRYLNRKGNWMSTLAEVDPLVGTASAPAVPKQVGSNVFNGWDRALTGITENCVITAVYEKLCILTFFYYDYNGIWKAEQVYVKAGSTAEAAAPKPPEVVRNPGRRFTGWDTDLKKAVSGDMTVRGNYTDIFVVEFIYHSGEDGTEKHTVKTADKGGSIKAPYISGSYREYGENCTEIYRFTGWYQGEEKLTEETGLTVSDVAGDMTVTARYEKSGRTLTPWITESDGTMIEVVEMLGKWYIANVPTYGHNKQRHYYTYPYIGAGGEEKKLRIADDCSAFAGLCFYVATNGKYKNIEQTSTGFADTTAEQYAKYGIIKLNAKDMEIEDLQPGDLLVQKGSHVEFVVSEPEQNAKTEWIIRKTFGWGDVWDAYPREKESNKVTKLTGGGFAQGSHEYEVVLRKVASEEE